MQPMAVQPECYACLLRLAELTVDLAARDPEMQAQTREMSRAIVQREFRPGAVPALIANRVHGAIREQTGNPDPYSSRKKEETAFLSRMFARIAPSYHQELDSLLRLAVVGNAIDYFRSEEEVTREILTPVAWSHADLEPFRRRLESSTGTLLYLADNAGEQFFDLPLVTYLRGRGWRTLFVVKGGPVQNDLTREDLYASGLGEALEPLADTGARTVGLVLAETSPAFQKIYGEADLILAKGMGHFETMSQIPDPRIFFLLQAKCPPVAQALGAPHQAFVFRQAPDS
jgi:uncharacterized protein with ATP-grasp and redox domains